MYFPNKVQVLASKPRSKPSPEYVYGSIESAPIPGVVDPKLREQGMAARTRAIRALLKTQGIKGVSVRQSTGSMCFWTYVDIPRLREGLVARATQADYQAMVHREHAVRQKVEAIILAAFPDLDDRSDAYTDYSDFVFMVGFQ